MAAGMKKGEILRGPPLSRVGVFALDDVETADAGADVNADALGILRRDLQAGHAAWLHRRPRWRDE